MKKQDIDKILDEEQQKLDRADVLKQRLDSYLFGVFDPRFWRTANELHEVVKSFALNRIFRP